MSGWNHAICMLCWRARNPSRDPVRIPMKQPETCCFCGLPTGAGIYVRYSPQLIPRCDGHDD